MKNIYLPIAILLMCACTSNAQLEDTIDTTDIISDEAIIEKYLVKGARKYSYFSSEWQLYLDSAISINPRMAYLYQQKAMPMFKQGKYEAGLELLNKAVELDTKGYIDYRAFIKCIFAKTYKDAIKDFEKAKTIINADGFVMDHTYNFYLALCYLQLNDFNRAIEFLNKSVQIRIKNNGENGAHHLEYFYLGIAYQELNMHKEALVYLNKTLSIYHNFSDAEYYKILSLKKINPNDESIKLLFEKCKKDFKDGYTINEDNSIYEKYPYKISNWYLGL